MLLDEDFVFLLLKLVLTRFLLSEEEEDGGFDE